MKFWSSAPNFHAHWQSGKPNLRPCTATTDSCSIIFVHNYTFFGKVSGTSSASFKLARSIVCPFSDFSSTSVICWLLSSEPSLTTTTDSGTLEDGLSFSLESLSTFPFLFPGLLCFLTGFRLGLSSTMIAVFALLLHSLFSILVCVGLLPLLLKGDFTGVRTNLHFTGVPLSSPDGVMSSSFLRFVAFLTPFSSGVCVFELFKEGFTELSAIELEFTNLSFVCTELPVILAKASNFLCDRAFPCPLQSSTNFFSDFLKLLFILFVGLFDLGVLFCKMFNNIFSKPSYIYMLCETEWVYCHTKKRETANFDLLSAMNFKDWRKTVTWNYIVCQLP